ncbi:alpha/beta hydrolase [Microbacterium lushaniae]|nr:alpha/beta hydrolase [Microbacterium lushaniae]KAA9159536.1 alpha/beta hydrolase [Microbacterium lushaniae]
MLALVATLAVAAVLSGCFLAPDPMPSRTPDTSGVSADLLPYYGQELEWSRCEGDAFDCTTVRAPLDWDDPSGGDLELAVIRQRATGDEAVGSLLTNPGGPGVSGYDYVRDGASALAGPEVAAAYDLVGFDPRGVGRSTPVTCLDDAGMDEFLYGIPDGRRGTPEWDESLTESAEAFALACEENSGDILPYISTVSAARDLDLLRAVLGDDSLNYLGYSWGTALGAQYAQLYPERVGRMVLDGAMDPALPGSAIGAAQAVGFEASLRAFFDDCAGREDCPYGGTVDDMLADLAALLARVDRTPVPAADGRRVGADTLMTGIIQTLYIPGTWPWLRVALSDLEDGDPTTILTAADSYNRRVDGEYLDNSTEAFTAYNCMDYPVEPSGSEQAAQERIRAGAPTTADYWFGADVCAFWPAEPTGTREPVTADGAAPILVIGTTADPATPYVWAESLAAQLSSGILVTRVGEGHTGYMKGNACVNETVDAYLVEGIVPEGDVVCR